jgi:hydroxymethylpyrimidine/phosphomethylpyrimidine kinase
MQPDQRIPAVLCTAGHDPSGGAGIFADGEAIRAAGAQALGVITCLTAQDTCGLRRLWPQPPAQVDEQCRLLLEDAQVAAIKIGLLGSTAMVKVLTGLIQDHPDLPVVMDPILATGTGQSVADAALCNQMRQRLFPAVTLLTPNVSEARTLSGATEPDDCAERLLRLGCMWVLITGTHAPGEVVTNRLYGRNGARRTWDWPRLPGEYHGSGCTLASAIAGRLALRMDLPDAVAEAQAYTWETLARARRTGRCQLTPNRLFALDADPGAEASAP